MSTQSCILLVLGAGLSRRFGENDKLEAMLNDRPLAQHVLQIVTTLPWQQKRVVSRLGGTWHGAYDQSGFHRLINPEPERGLGSSLALGIRGLEPQDRVLICLADMPFITPAHLLRLCAASEAEPHLAFATSSPSYRGPPAVFPMESLLKLSPEEDMGARSLIRTAQLLCCPTHETTDIDDAASLAAITQASPPSDFPGT
ncbi:nucleotidyltransferase family protein [Asaia sp. HN010]|uniref:nucleotidyltransferase family protein n=1 Tax=Asaia sp. HN010 TaxID=3081233 RepID=UPI0030179157